ncbi:hypothetical protein HO173_007775 [Letharia columbiana]|uniref:Uncharacterized protein n=1 Tax=Letharia columbiana TaxID=112416 RepID=A0A8H6FSI4_9LECA|nr:uncharacterized protein HO173_007775 [Letharia columbiana]KAF6233945.1 hypothetical protein HO173_007775 [Letharia columbiana]
MALDQGNGSFTGQTESHAFAGFLFDVDGTIINTTDAVTKHWQRIGAELGVDPDVILRNSRGRRSIDTLRLYDPSKATWEYVRHIESLIPKLYGSGVTEIRGARPLLESMGEANAPWALVTSCTRTLLSGWLDLLALPPPPASVAAEDVAAGKPDPACYNLGRERIGLGERARVLVAEDAPAGVKAGKAAGCMVLGLATTHGVDQLRDAGADWIIEDLTCVKVAGKGDDGWKISIEKMWVQNE